MWKFIKIVKRMNSKVVMVSEDGKVWRPLESAYDLEGDFDIRFEGDFTLAYYYDGENKA